MFCSTAKRGKMTRPDMSLLVNALAASTCINKPDMSSNTLVSLL